MTTWSGRSGARRVGRRGVAELQDANVHTLSDRVVGQDGKILFLRGVPAGARSAGAAASCRRFTEATCGPLPISNTPAY